MNLNIREYGEGHPLVILHGLFGSADNWHSVARKIQSGYRVIVPDLPNHGASPHTVRFDYPTMISAVTAFIDQLDLTRPVIAGHSMGGKIAMLLALERPESIGGLVVVDIAPRRYEPTVADLLRAMQSLLLSQYTRRGEVDSALADAIPNAAVRSFLLKNLAADATGLRWRLNLDGISRDYEHILEWAPPRGTYLGPSLFVGGERSTYLQPERDSTGISALFPNAEIEVIPDAGHWLHADRQTEFLEVLNTFLSGQDGFGTP